MKKILLRLLGACIIFFSATTVFAAAEDLKLSINAGNAVFASDDKVIIKFKVTNTGNETIGILDWKLPKEQGEWEEDVFSISRDGLKVAYKGRHVKRPEPSNADYRYLKPGQKITIKAVLSDAYDFADTGYYNIQYKTSSGSLLIDAKNIKSKKVTTLKSEQKNAYINGRLFQKSNASGKPGAGCKGNACPPPADGFYACSDDQKALVLTAKSDASSIANAAFNYLGSANTNSQRYAKWFGAYDANRWTTVEGNFDAIANAIDTEALEFDCGCKQRYYAYVYADQPYRVYLCKVFWTAPATGQDSKAGTIVHEVSHFSVVAGTDDVVYGQSGAADLALSDPDAAITNADSHEYFAENAPAIP